ncbi:MAG: hypothetical protein AAFQ63_04095 [Cyanobacteria bacterium J06621_11]
MSETLTIELPDSVAQQLKLFADSGNIPLSELIAETLCMFADMAESLQTEDASTQAQLMQKLKERVVNTTQLSRAEAVNTLNVDQPDIEQRSVGQKTDSILDAGHDALLALAGTLELGTTDLGENHDKYIAEALERELIPDE